MAALSLTLPLIAATFASCGDDGTYSGVNSNSNYTYNYKTEAEENYSPNTVNPNEEYKHVEETGFKNPKSEPLSTFSADVDTASYTNARRMLNEHQIVDADSVRIEEYINYFDYKYADPEEGKVFGEYVELADCPWNPDTKLMMIGLQGKRMAQEELPPSNLVFLIDSSGSMDSYNKLPLVQTAFSMLTDTLTENDRISIVTYAGSSETVLAGASGTDKDEITEALGSIMAQTARAALRPHTSSPRNTSSRAATTVSSSPPTATSTSASAPRRSSRSSSSRSARAAYICRCSASVRATSRTTKWKLLPTTATATTAISTQSQRHAACSSRRWAAHFSR